MTTIEDIEEVREEFPNSSDAMIYYIANYENEIWEDITKTKIIDDRPIPEEQFCSHIVKALFVRMKLDDKYRMSNDLGETEPELLSSISTKTVKMETHDR
ncbi:hypothetical protein JTB14_012617 [Gonioctena quinquepunctata]|nr:hypothetical protein JTB14_012617 [Gonioctena quinquepunctata]